LDDALRFEEGKGGLTRVVIDTPASTGQMYLHGAHVTHFQPAGQKPVLFMSTASHYASGKPIRGGVPICLPWFGPLAGQPDAPAHGFARLSAWEVESTERLSDGVRITLGFHGKPGTSAFWSSEFEARYVVSFTSVLTMQLQITNLSNTPMRFEEALHTYLSVGDVKQVRVTGLEGVKYVSKVEGGTFDGSHDPITITSETDRIYLNTQSTVKVIDPSMNRTIVVGKSGSDTTVVWNPWVNKSKAMPDFGDEEWPGMVCVETCNNTEDFAVSLRPGERHSMVATVSVER
jgi:D-hexose-6-phosphate mutarotase